MRRPWARLYVRTGPWTRGSRAPFNRPSLASAHQGLVLRRLNGSRRHVARRRLLSPFARLAIRVAHTELGGSRRCAHRADERFVCQAGPVGALARRTAERLCSASAAAPGAGHTNGRPYLAPTNRPQLSTSAGAGGASVVGAASYAIQSIEPDSARIGFWRGARSQRPPLGRSHRPAQQWEPHKGRRPSR